MQSGAFVPRWGRMEDISGDGKTGGKIVEAGRGEWL